MCIYFLKGRIVNFHIAWSPLFKSSTGRKEAHFHFQWVAGDRICLSEEIGYCYTIAILINILIHPQNGQDSTSKDLNLGLKSHLPTFCAAIDLDHTLTSILPMCSPFSTIWNAFFSWCLLYTRASSGFTIPEDIPSFSRSIITLSSDSLRDSIWIFWKVTGLWKNPLAVKIWSLPVNFLNKAMA